MGYCSYRKLYKENQKGFTLIELLVILVLIAVISSISVGALTFFNDPDIEDFQQEIFSIITLGIDESIISGKVHGLFRQGDKIYLKKYSREVKQEENNNIKKSVGSIFSGLVAIGSSKKEGQESSSNESKEPPKKGNKEVAKSNNQALTPAASKNNKGEFADEEPMSWVDVNIRAIMIPKGYKLSLDAKDEVTKEFVDKLDVKQQNYKNSLNTDKNNQTAISAQKLITTFWPSGLIQPAGSAIISNDERKTLEVEWQENGKVTSK